MKFPKLATALSLALASVALPAHAQGTDFTDLGVAAGATVFGPQGNEVGKVVSIAGENVVVDTGNYKATLPGAAFGKSDKGPTITATKDQIDAAMAAAMQQAQAKVDAALVPGAALRTSDGVAIGTIKSVGADGLVVIDREAGAFAMKKDMFGTDANGLILRMSSQALAEAMAETAANAGEASEG